MSHTVGAVIIPDGLTIHTGPSADDLIGKGVGISAAFENQPDDEALEKALEPYNENVENARWKDSTREQLIQGEREDIERYRDTTYAEYKADPKAYREKYRHASDAHIRYLEGTLDSIAGLSFPDKLAKLDDDEWLHEQATKWHRMDDAEREPADRLIDAEGNLWSTGSYLPRWDWYTVGGRWSGYIDGRNEAPLSEFISWAKQNPKEAIPYFIVTPRKDDSPEEVQKHWHERGRMGWFGMSSGEKDGWPEEAVDIFEKALEEYPNARVVMVDIHI